MNRIPRRTVGALGLLACFLILIFSQGSLAESQEIAALEFVVHDAEGDVEFHGEHGILQPALSEDARRVDFQSFQMGPDTAEAIPVQFSFVDGTEDGMENPFEGFRVRVDFTVAGVDYAVLPIFASCDSPQFALYSVTDAGSIDRSLSCIPAEYDPASATYTLNLPRVSVRTPTGGPLPPGTTVENIQATAWASIGGTQAPDEPGGEAGWYQDQVAEDAPGQFRVSSGGRQSPEATFTVASPEAIRATNGANSTFRFHVTIVNPSDDAKTLEASVEQVWDGARVYANKTVGVGPHDSVDTGVYLDVPFGHAHGETRTFSLRYTDSESQQWAEIDLGLHWLDVPQPAGHHPRLWFHSSTSTSGERGLWMNAVEDDPSPSAMDEPKQAFGKDNGMQEVGRQGSRHYWHIALAPQLQMGLDFQADAPSVLTGQFDQLTVGSEVTVEAGLAFCQASNSPDREQQSEFPYEYQCEGDVQQIARSEVETFPVQSSEASFDVALDLETESPAIPYSRDQNLVIYLEMIQYPSADPLIPTSTSPRLVVSGTTLDLALNEYTEPSPLSGEALNPDASESPLELLDRPGVDAHESPGIHFMLLIAAVGLLAVRLHQ